MTVAERIRNTRRNLGWSQDELASRLGYKDKTSVSKIENSGDNITMKKIDKISSALGVTPEYLMGWEKEEQFERMRKYASHFSKALDRKTEEAVILYDLYQNASPEARKAVEVLLKFEPPQA